MEYILGIIAVINSVSLIIITMVASTDEELPLDISQQGAMKHLLKDYICCPVDLFKYFNTKYNIVGAGILTLASCILYPSVLIVSLIWIMVSTFCWAFNMLFKRKGDKED